MKADESSAGRAKHGAQQPKWVMCALCGDVIYGGPGPYPALRECECGATVVQPTPEKGKVAWDAERYAAAGVDEPEIEWTEEQLDPNAVIKPEPRRTIDDTVAAAYDRLEKTGEV